MFQATIGRKFAALNLLEKDINSMTENMKNVLVESATEILGKKKKINKPWITDNIWNLCDKRRELKKNSKQDTETLGQRRATNKIIGTRLRKNG
jgi:hypothetical protein